MRVSEFEHRVWQVDRLRIIIRASSRAAVQDFDWVNAADQGIRMSRYFKTRIAPKVGNLEVVIIGGNGEVPYGNTQIATIRQSYDRQ